MGAPHTINVTVHLININQDVGILHTLKSLRNMSDPVNHPEHYNQGDIECIDALKACMTHEEFSGFLRGNAMKYLWRFRHKGGGQDLLKAEWYQDRLLLHEDVTDSALCEGAHVHDAETPKENMPDKLWKDWTQFYYDTSALLEKVEKHPHLALSNWTLVAVTRDGLFPCGLASKRWDIRNIETFCIQSYRKHSRGKIEIIKGIPERDIEEGGSNLIFIDAISDTGATASFIKNLFPDSIYAAVYVKPQGNVAAIDYWGKEVPNDRWLKFPWDSTEDQ